MAFIGNGTGSVTYAINNEDPVTVNTCTVQVLEDDTAETLTLAVNFTDNTYGQVQVGICLSNYVPSQKTYTDTGSLTIAFCSETNCWMSSNGSTLQLSVSQEKGTNTTTYKGIFDADNLAWVLTGSQESLTLKFDTFVFSVVDVLSFNSPNQQAGTGSGSVTYTIGNESPPTQTVTVYPWITMYNSNGTLTSLLAVLSWNDPNYGLVWLYVTVNPFSGSGDYNSTSSVSVSLTSADYSAGSWNSSSNSSVDFDVTGYEVDNNTLTVQGSLNASGLTWDGQGSQDNLDLDVTSLSLTITLEVN
jgi:hypothetical protein